MKTRKNVVLLLLVTALLLALAPGLNTAAEEETVWEYKGYFDKYIRVKVTAPAQAHPGDKITIEVEVQARDDKGLKDIVVDIWVVGTLKEGTEPWKSGKEYKVIKVSTLDYKKLKSGDCKILIDKDVDFGLICGHIHCEFYSVTDKEEYYFDAEFPMTYLLGAISKTKYETLLSERDKWKTDYTSLKSDYDSLKATYDSLKLSHESLQADYSKLSSKYDDLEDKYSSLDSKHTKLVADYADLESRYETTANKLGDFKTYVYVLVGTTMLFVVTTIIFAVRPRARE